jgi:hypothetical protein
MVFFCFYSLTVGNPKKDQQLTVKPTCVSRVLLMLCFKIEVQRLSLVSVPDCLSDGYTIKSQGKG